MSEEPRDLFGNPWRNSPVAADLAEFIGWIVERYLARSGVDQETAHVFAEAFFEGQFLPDFGDPSHDWTKGDAYDLADEDMTYWEDDG